MFDPISNFKRYVVLLAIFFTVGGAAVLVNTTIGANAWFRWNPLASRHDNFVAFSQSGLFGDYEHGALYYGIETQAVDHLRKADVLILGSSRAAVAFSTKATERVFGSLGAHVYVLAFGYAEQSRFALALIRKYDLHPKAVIIDADPYFVDKTDDQFEKVLQNDPDTYLSYLIKAYFQRAQKVLCNEVSSACGDGLTVYRSAIDGRWQIDDFFRLKAHREIPVTSNWNYRIAELPEIVKVAKTFRESLPIPNSCIIITSIPSNEGTPTVAKIVAGKLNASYVVPDLDGLRTFDTRHLVPKDAELWSNAMLKDALHILETCLAR